VAGQKIRVDGHEFRNERELQVYLGVLKMARDGRLTGLKVLPEFVLTVNETVICTYTPTFQFHDEDGRLRTIQVQARHPSSALTIKKTLFEALLGLTVEEWG
jgi:hypothetical protein